MRPRPKRKLRNGTTREGAIYKLCADYRSHARRRGHDWNLTHEDAGELFFAPCHYCGLEYSRERHGFKFNGIDRADNSRGYEPGNCVTACGFCNFAKRGNSVQDFYAWIERITDHNKKMQSDK